MLMLWYSDDAKPLTERISMAADYYRSKYGRSPSLCLVPTEEGPIPTSVGGISLEARADVLPCHLQIGGE